MEDTNIYIQKLEIFCKKYKINMDTPISKLSKKNLDLVLYGSDELIRFKFKSKGGNEYDKLENYEGVVGLLERRYKETNSSLP